MASKKGKSNSTSKAISASTSSENQGVQSNGTKDSNVTNSSVTDADAEATDVKSDDVKNGVKAENSSEKDTHQAADSELEPVAAVKGKAKSARTSKKTGKVQEVKAIDNPSAVSEEASKTPTIADQPQPISKKAAKEQSSEKSGKKKRLTLDISKSLHKAIKAKAVEEGVPMVDMLRSLLEKHYGK